MYRVTVRDSRGRIARDEAQIHDPSNDAEVVAAAKRVCEARRKGWPDAPRIDVDEFKGRGWHPVRTLVP
ncbi:MAG TPA: hypothetical protein VFM55_18955 [Micromonosporaceae bacterium]|nr:hypothetical protein [Micromonosporaceae bacterium]